MFSLSAISLLMRPLVISTSTSISRAERSCPAAVFIAISECLAGAGFPWFLSVLVSVLAQLQNVFLPDFVRPDRCLASACPTVGGRFHH